MTNGQIIDELQRTVEAARARAMFTQQYLAYCSENGREPFDQLRHDGNMANFIIWSARKKENKT
jgi:hypothetical protein